MLRVIGGNQALPYLEGIHKEHLMKPLSPVFALTALAAATVATAQQTPPSAEPPPDTNQSQSQTMPLSETAPPSDTSSGIRKADKKELMENCITRVQADNPSATANDIKDVCKKRLKSYSSPQSPRNSLPQSLSARQAVQRLVSSRLHTCCAWEHVYRGYPSSFETLTDVPGHR
jgi:hypothetical protein